jgi:Mlc titration factor MtfA (ptsG expression regulator)
MTYFIVLFIIFVIALIVFKIQKKAKITARRKVLKLQPFPVSWEIIMKNKIQLYKAFPENLKNQLHNDIKIFIDEKKFEGCGGLVVTEEMKVVIAAEACMLLLNRENNDFPFLKTILIYPHAFTARNYNKIGNQYVNEPSTRSGESWTRGNVVLAWDYVKHGAINGKDGQNVVLHEFAHQLDQEDGAANGAPILEKKSRYISWGKVFSKEFVELNEKLKKHQKTLMDSYGATNPAEFFAVATETFFEKS